MNFFIAVEAFWLFITSSLSARSLGLEKIIFKNDIWEINICLSLPGRKNVHVCCPSSNNVALHKNNDSVKKVELSFFLNKVTNDGRRPT